MSEPRELGQSVDDVFHIIHTRNTQIKSYVSGIFNLPKADRLRFTELMEAIITLMSFHYLGKNLINKSPSYSNNRISY